jgi:hypothetical protein
VDPDSIFTDAREPSFRSRLRSKRCSVRNMGFGQPGSKNTANVCASLEGRGLLDWIAALALMVFALLPVSRLPCTWRSTAKYLVTSIYPNKVRGACLGTKDGHQH